MTGDPKVLKFAEDKKDGDEEEGALCDVAPTVLDIMVRRAAFCCLYTALLTVCATIGFAQA